MSWFHGLSERAELGDEVLAHSLRHGLTQLLILEDAVVVEGEVEDARADRVAHRQVRVLLQQAQRRG